MLEQSEDALRVAAHAWLDATAQLDAALGGGSEPADVMTLADNATLARLRFHQALTELGWTPPSRSVNDAKPT